MMTSAETLIQKDIHSKQRSKLKSLGKMSRLFYTYGKVCASHPCEVMVAFFSLLFVSIFSMSSRGLSQTPITPSRNCHLDSDLERASAESLSNTILVISRCLALFYIYHQFKNLYNLGSKYLVGISALFTVFSSFIFCSAVLYALNANFVELNDALPFFFLLSDLSKASLLAQFALSSNTREEVRENIAQGMAILGPSLTLDTLVETLAIGVGTVSGVSKIEEISCFACVSVLVNYVVFMILFPACLSLALELSHNREDNVPVWRFTSLTKVLQLESEKASNPVIQRIKLIMSAALMLVHTLSRWPIGPESEATVMNIEANSHDFLAEREFSFFETLIRKYLMVCSEQFVMIGLVFALAVKYIFFENKDYYSEQIRQQYQQNQEIQQNIKQVHDSNYCKTPAMEPPSIFVTAQDSDTESYKNSKLKNSDKSVSSREGSVKGDGYDDEKTTFFIGDDYSSEVSETEYVDCGVQTDEIRVANEDSRTESEIEAQFSESKEIRDINTLVQLLNSADDRDKLTTLEVKYLVEKGYIQDYKLESILGNSEKGVAVRRLLIEDQSNRKEVLSKVPFTRYDYSLVLGACCENVIGYVPVPLGVAGPLIINKKKYYVPMATTEGCLVASTNRGCRALVASGGVSAAVFSDGMTRGPVVHFPTAMRAAEAMNWLQKEENFQRIKEAFDGTSRFARLSRIHPRVAGRYLYIRFVGTTGDAMGMNMLSKGTESALQELSKVFKDIEASCLSGNFCTDKKAAAVNWIEGRGKSVVCEAIVPAKIIRDTLKTSAAALEEFNISKNLIGSAVAATIGGNNAHAANIVAAIYIACGQDPAQTVGSSNCITLMEAHGEDLHVSCTMPSIEIGTIGGGTVLNAQSACLELLGVKGCSLQVAGNNSSEFASIVCASVMAGELSLMSALAAGHLVRSHMKHNRSNININTETVPLAMNSIPNLSTNGLVRECKSVIGF